MRTLRRVLAATALLAATACGGDSGQTVAAPPVPPSPTAEPSAAPPVEPVPSPVRLTGDGIETTGGLIPFGEPYDAVADRLVEALGTPTTDTGETDSATGYGACPGSRLRALEFGDGALRLLFGDVIGPGLTLYQWALTAEGSPADVPRASALVGDTTTLEFGVGTPLAELEAGAATGTLTVVEGDELVGPSYRLTDQSAGFAGPLSGTGEGATVTGVLAGEPCGE